MRAVSANNFNERCLNAKIAGSTPSVLWFDSSPQGGINALKQVITLKPGHPAPCTGSSRNAAALQRSFRPGFFFMPY